MPGADELMLRIYAALAQKEREFISAPGRCCRPPRRVGRCWAATGAGGQRHGPDAGKASLERLETAQRAAHRLVLKVERLCDEGVTTQASVARALTARGVPNPQGRKIWTHTKVARVMARVGT
jgi:hypothetical protein